MSFRTKLLCVIAVPVLFLLTVAGLAASGNMDGNIVADLAAFGALASTAVCIVLARTVAQPLLELTDAANALATEQLPALVEGLASPSDEDHRYLAATIKPIKVRASDEIGQLAAAFNTVQTVAVDVAAEQAALLRKGMAELFVNLARRNQLLIDRQIEMFDELEAAETDPEALAKLYKLDHLTTRMRRNAESLLVLAGAETTRRRTEPVPLVDVVRAAIGETEDYARIDIAALDEVQLDGASAVDIGHLLAELLENATQLSPPDSRVTISARLSRGALDITIVDRGVGMSTDALATANELLASPPALGFALTKTLGFTVVSRLAARHAVSIRLASPDASGVVAIVHVPHQLVIVPTSTESAPEAEVVATEPASEASTTAAGDFDELVRGAWADAPLDDRGWADASPDADADAGAAVGADVEPLFMRHAREDDPPAALADALPAAHVFEAGLGALTRGDDVLGPATLIEPAVEVPTTTRAGLAKRQPKAVAQPATPAPEAPSMLASNRSPEEVRSLLSRYRASLDQARAGEAPPASPAPEAGQ